MGSGGVPLLLVHGGPGYPSDVLFEAFEPLAMEREVVWYDQLGVGRSDRIEDTALLTGTLKEWDIFHELERIRIPTLVLGGEFDECVPTHLADIAAQIPDSEHVTQAGAAHMGYLEAEPLRGEYVGMIRDYLARVETRGW
ncbi:hypothetical protein [Saccharopolyspora sp. NPDC050642]|uniref:hypothetical protein n=1 Tax=Saccharopolyspora sp. NPDC050642 TaxID=3157099 RepID=UPI0033CA8585